VTGCRRNWGASVVDLLDPLQPGGLRSALAERYQVERKVGEGGMAAVYLARDLRHSRPVALKVVRPELATALGSERFLREIRVVANLQHPHILPLFDSGEAEGALFFVMPFVEGESLRRRLLREPEMPVDEALRITREAAEALAYAHDRGVVHCDVKPENLLLQNGHVLVADFGIARAVGSAEPLARGGHLVGTAQYMSPEQALGETELDGRSDVYSLGCVLYEMLAGAPPFEGETTTTVVARHSLEQVPHVSSLHRVVSERVQDVLRRALAKTRSERWSMAEFAAALAGLEVEVRHPMRSTWSARHWVWTVSGAAVVLAVAFWALRPPSPIKPAAAALGRLDPRHIAVLYFQPRVGQDSLAYLADGVTEELIHQLSRVPTLRVISQNGVDPYRRTNASPDSVARALRVGTLVQGTVAQSGGRLRMSVALIDGATGAELGSTNIERPHQEIFALQDDLAQEVAVFLRRRLGEEVERKMAESRAQRHRPRAWHLFQRAEELTRDVEQLLAAGDTTGAAVHLNRADSLLVLAQQVEPGWVRPSVARGRLALSRLDLVGTFDKPYYDRWTRAGLAHAQQALRIDGEDAEALDLRGSLRYYRWLLNLAASQAESSELLAGAESDLQDAVASDSTAASAWTVLSHLRMSQSQPAQAKLAALRAYQADPYFESGQETLWRLFQSSLDLEDTAESRRWCDEGRRRFPESYRFVECQLWLYALEGQSLDLGQLEPLYRRYLELAPPTARAWHEHYGRMVVAIALARAGLRDSADAVARRARADTVIDETRDLANLEAIARTILGERDEAFRLLGLYLSANPQFRGGMAREKTWWFRDLRADPRYPELVRPRQAAATR
jgi:eukaryotic-like serine/threonine-protein kinase